MDAIARTVQGGYMIEYINRQALRDAMYHEAFETDSDLQKWDSGCWIRYKMFENVMDRLPSADVQPVRHGKWIPKFNGQFKGGAYWYDCSVCGRIVPDVRNGGWNYCPNCGARMATMDGDENG